MHKKLIALLVLLLACHGLGLLGTGSSSATSGIQCDYRCSDGKLWLMGCVTTSDPAVCCALAATQCQFRGQTITFCACPQGPGGPGGGA